MTVQTDRTLIRGAGNSRRHALVTFSAPDAPHGSSRAPVNVAFVLDRSGSMGGSKIALAKQALFQALLLLRPADRFAIVFYDHQIDLVVPSTLATAEAVENAARQVQAIQARGNTDLGGGWLRGCQQIAEHLDGQQIGKCLLLTDGLANQGITDPIELERHARELSSRGVATSTLGLGQGFNEELLQRMADAGRGHSYHIETAVQIADTLTSEIGETLETVAREAVVRVMAEADVRVTTLNAFEVRQVEGGAEIRLGDLVARQAVSVVVRLEFPAGVEGSTSRALFGVKDRTGALTSIETDVIWTYAAHGDNDRQPRNVTVDREVARLYAAKAREEALALNGAGRFEEAERRLKATADRIRQYAGNDPVLNEIILELEQRQVSYSAVLSAGIMKSERYASYNVARMRAADGKARRGPDA